MARNSLLLRSSLLARTLLSNPSTNKFSPVSNHPSFSTKALTSHPPLPSYSSQSKPLFFFPARSFSTSAPNIVAIDSEQHLNTSLKRAKDDAAPSVFYFTAIWCPPCKVVSPVMEDLSKTYPHVTTYKVDIDKEELQNKLSDLKIYSVPTLHFYQNGERASEIVGANIALLKQTMEDLYKQA